MSAMIFCMTITMALQRALTRQATNEDQLLADDITIACARGDLIKILEDIKDELQTIGLVLNDNKTQLYMSAWGETPNQEEFQTLWKRHGSTEGIVLCGHPLDLQESPAHPQCPMGSSAFVDQWLKQRAKRQDQMVDTLVRIAEAVTRERVCARLHGTYPRPCGILLTNTCGTHCLCRTCYHGSKTEETASYNELI